LNTYVPFPSRYYSLVASTPGSILLQTSRMDTENYRSYLFLHPERKLTASESLFDEIEQALAGGSYVAGFLTYEFGAHLQMREGARYDADRKSVPASLAWFGIYSEAFIYNHRTGKFEGRSPDQYMAEDTPPDSDFEIDDLHLNIPREIYTEKITKIQDYIRAGDTYQVNFTNKLRFDFSGSPEALFAALIDSQPVPYSAFLNTGNKHILSFSPELFFRLKDREIVTRPMKGTAPRGMDLADDALKASWLQNDLKNRSENLMIVDLMRNDLGRICEFGSIAVNQLFAVERYETLFQMTSEISGTLREGLSFSDIFRSLFPCGSITGAPKLRTMEIIQELEQEPRGVYTGAIGYFSPVREAVFNVPIRTVVLENGHGTMGVGSGIVIDSLADDEFCECLLKAEFLTHREEPFQLIESILWNDGYTMLSLHLDRMELSAKYFGFSFDRTSVLSVLEEAKSEFASDTRVKVRVLLGRSGIVNISHAPVEVHALAQKVVVSAMRVSSSDRFLRHKTTHRGLYDQQLTWAHSHGYAEVIFLNEQEEVTEGAISNIFIEKDGLWFTPPVECGLLSGIYRRHLLETRPAIAEKVLSLEDLASADAVYLCNAVRGIRKVTVVQIREEEESLRSCLSDEA
jgi:para-aminobenzoate synthetase/4-amino-4-deoxychorismate lyase